MAYHIQETKAGENGEQRGVWTRVGAAWPTKDGQGFHGVLAVVPLDGRLMRREPLARAKAGGMPPHERVSSSPKKPEKILDNTFASPILLYAGSPSLSPGRPPGLGPPHQCPH
jgi:hypothetical protein